MMTPDEAALDLQYWFNMKPGHWQQLGALEREAEAIGQHRFELGWEDRLNDGTVSLVNCLLGARGELASGLWLGIPLDLVLAQMRSKQSKGSPDHGQHLGVRTRSQWPYELNVMPEDPTKFRYLLVTEIVLAGVRWHVMRGWQTGKRCKEAPTLDPRKRGAPKGTKGGHPGHFVPHPWLRNALELRARVRRLYPEDPGDPMEMIREVGRAAFHIDYEA